MLSDLTLTYVVSWFHDDMHRKTLFAEKEK